MCIDLNIHDVNVKRISIITQFRRRIMFSSFKIFLLINIILAYIILYMYTYIYINATIFYEIYPHIRTTYIYTMFINNRFNWDQS